MTTLEVGQVLAVAAAFDQRTTGEVDIDAWSEVIGDMDFGMVRAMVIRWYSRHRERIMPVEHTEPRGRVRRYRLLGEVRNGLDGHDRDG